MCVCNQGTLSCRAESPAKLFVFIMTRITSDFREGSRCRPCCMTSFCERPPCGRSFLRRFLRRLYSWQDSWASRPLADKAWENDRRDPVPSLILAIQKRRCGLAAMAYAVWLTLLLPFLSFLADADHLACVPAAYGRGAGHPMTNCNPGCGRYEPRGRRPGPVLPYPSQGCWSEVVLRVQEWSLMLPRLSGGVLRQSFRV